MPNRLSVIEGNQYMIAKRPATNTCTVNVHLVTLLISSGIFFHFFFFVGDFWYFFPLPTIIAPFQHIKLLFFGSRLFASTDELLGKIMLLTNRFCYIFSGFAF